MCYVSCDAFITQSAAETVRVVSSDTSNPAMSANESQKAQAMYYVYTHTYKVRKIVSTRSARVFSPRFTSGALQYSGFAIFHLIPFCQCVE